MKISKRKVFLAALAVSLVAIVSLGSLAWFSASDSVNNNFYVADSTLGEPDEIFSVSVVETTPAGTGKDGHNYYDILPGSTYDKEPIVTNTGYYSQYIRVIVEISDAQAWFAALGYDYNLIDVFEGFDSTAWDMGKTWNNVAEASANGTLNQLQKITYVLYYNDVLESGESFSVFTDVVIPESLTQAQVAEFGTDGFSINVKAQAVQSENTGSSAYQAFTDVVGMSISQ